MTKRIRMTKTIKTDYKRITALIVALTVCVCCLAGCYKSNSDYGSGGYVFDDLAYRRPNIDRLYELADKIEEKKDSVFAGFDIFNSMNEMFDIYTDLMAMDGLLQIYTNRDVTDEYLANESFEISSAMTDVQNTLWKAVDTVATHAGGWLTRVFVDTESVLMSFGGSYGGETEEEKEFNELTVKELSLLKDYTTANGIEYAVDGDAYDFLYPIPDGAKEYTDNGDGTKTWLLTSDEISLLLEEGYISDEVAYKMMSDIEHQQFEVFGEIYVELVKVRNKIAENKGYAGNYGGYSYKELFGRDFTLDEVHAMRELLKPKLSGLAGLLYEPISKTDFDAADSQAAIAYKAGIINSARPVLADISERFTDVLDEMERSGFCDLEYDDRKMDISFTMTLPVYDKPFLFIQPSEEATTTDVSTFFHEFGHYFHQSVIPEARYSNDIDTAEVLSQALELLATKYYGKFYPDRDMALGCRAETVYNLVNSVIEALIVDEFQERTFAEENLTPERTTEIYVELLKEYGLGDNFDDVTKNAWVHIYHIFAYPFYYISYGVSAVTAAAIYNSDDPVDKYMSFCDNTADKALRENCEACGLGDPADADQIYETLEKIVTSVLSGGGAES